MTRKSKHIFAALLSASLIVFASGCQNQTNTVNESSSQFSESENNSKSSESENSSQQISDSEKSEVVKSDGYDKFSRLKIGMTESEVNEILGEPTKVDKAYYYYNITVNGHDMEISVWINTTSGLVTNINGNFSADEYRAEFADSETDFSAVDGLDSGEIATYDDCVAAFKTQGYLISINEDDVKRYLWVDSSDGHICITFRADGSVKSYVGCC